MKKLLVFLLGLIFGITLIKSEVVSWFRIQEMFRFQAFHMYGVIGSAVVVGAIAVQVIKKFKLTATGGDLITLDPKPFNKVGNIAGGVIFGLGWALTGACPGPLYALLGNGYSVILVVLLSALLGAALYHLIKGKLPH